MNHIPIEFNYDHVIINYFTCLLFFFSSIVIIIFNVILSNVIVLDRFSNYNLLYIILI